MNFQYQGPRFPRGRRGHPRGNFHNRGRGGQNLRAHWHNNPGNHQYRARFTPSPHNNWSSPSNFHGTPSYNSHNIFSPGTPPLLSRSPLLPHPTAFPERSFRSPPPLPPARTSPLPGSEEYIQRNIKETSERIKKQLNLENEDDEEDEETPKVEIMFNSTFKPDAIFSEAPNIEIEVDINQVDGSMKTDVPKIRRDSKCETKYDVEEIRNKIIAHITNLSAGKKMNLINIGSESYDEAIHQIQKNERLAIIRALRDTCSDQPTEASSILSSIIPDMDIKIEDLPADKREELSSSLKIYSDEIFGAYESTVDPDVMFQQAQEMLSGLPDDIDSVLEDVHMHQDNTTLCNMELSPLNTELLTKSNTDIENNLDTLIEPLEDPAAETLKIRELLNEPVISSDMSFRKKSPQKIDSPAQNVDYSVQNTTEAFDRQRALEESYKQFEAEIYSSLVTYSQPETSPISSERFLNDSGRFKSSSGSENSATEKISNHVAGEDILPLDFNFSSSYLNFKSGVGVSKTPPYSVEQVQTENEAKIMESTASRQTENKIEKNITNQQYPSPTRSKGDDLIKISSELIQQETKAPFIHKLSLDERIARELQKDTQQEKNSKDNHRKKTQHATTSKKTKTRPNTPQEMKTQHDFLQPKVTETAESHRRKVWRSPGEKKFMSEQKNKVSLYEHSDTDLDFSGTDTEDENRSPHKKNTSLKEMEVTKKIESGETGTSFVSNPNEINQDCRSEKLIVSDLDKANKKHLKKQDSQERIGTSCGKEKIDQGKSDNYDNQESKPTIETNYSFVSNSNIETRIPSALEQSDKKQLDDQDDRESNNKMQDNFKVNKGSENESETQTSNPKQAAPDLKKNKKQSNSKKESTYSSSKGTNKHCIGENSQEQSIKMATPTNLEKINAQESNGALEFINLESEKQQLNKTEHNTDLNKMSTEITTEAHKTTEVHITKATASTQNIEANIIQKDEAESESQKTELISEEKEKTSAKDDEKRKKAPNISETNITDSRLFLQNEANAELHTITKKKSRDIDTAKEDDSMLLSSQAMTDNKRATASKTGKHKNESTDIEANSKWSEGTKAKSEEIDSITNVETTTTGKSRTKSEKQESSPRRRASSRIRKSVAKTESETNNSKLEVMSSVEMKREIVEAEIPETSKNSAKKKRFPAGRRSKESPSGNSAEKKALSDTVTNNNNNNNNNDTLLVVDNLENGEKSAQEGAADTEQVTQVDKNGEQSVHELRKEEEEEINETNRPEISKHAQNAKRKKLSGTRKSKESPRKNVLTTGSVEIQPSAEQNTTQEIENTIEANKAVDINIDVKQTRSLIRTRSKRAKQQQTNIIEPQKEETNIVDENIITFPKRNVTEMAKEKHKSKSKKSTRAQKRRYKASATLSKLIIKIEDSDADNFTSEFEDVKTQQAAMDSAEENSENKDSSQSGLLRVKSLSQLMPCSEEGNSQDFATESENFEMSPHLEVATTLEQLESSETRNANDTTQMIPLENLAVAKETPKQNSRKRKLSASYNSTPTKQARVAVSDVFCQTEFISQNFKHAASQTYIPCFNCEIYKKDLEKKEKWVDEMQKIDETIQSLLLAKAELYDRLLGKCEVPSHNVRRVARKRTAVVSKPISRNCQYISVQGIANCSEKGVNNRNTLFSPPNNITNTAFRRNLKLDSKCYQPCYVHLYRYTSEQIERMRTDMEYLRYVESRRYQPGQPNTVNNGVSNFKIVSVTSLAINQDNVESSSEIIETAMVDDEHLRAVLSERLKDVVLVLKVAGSELLAATDMGKIHCFDLKSGALSYIIQSSNMAITSLCFLKNKEGDILCVGSLDATLKLYNYSDKRMKKHVQLEDKVQCMETMWGYIFMGSDKGHLTRYNAEKNRREFHQKISDSNVLVIKATMEGARRVLLVALKQSPVCVRDAMSGLLMRNMEAPFSPSVYTILLDKNYVYCGTSKHDILVYNFYDGQLVRNYQPQPSSSGVVVLHMLGRLLFAGCYNGHIYVFNTATNDYLGFIKGPGGLLLSMSIINDSMIVVGTKQKHMAALQIPKEYLQQK